MKLCRFITAEVETRIGSILDEQTLLDLTPAGISRITPLLESDDPVAELRRIAQGNLPRLDLSAVKLCAPVERQEVWAAGVTYLRSKAARMEESQFSAN